VTDNTNDGEHSVTATSKQTRVDPLSGDADSAYLTYSRALQLILLDFQFIEEALRMCLVQAYRVVSVRTAGFLSYKPPIAALEKDPLGRLISKFETFFDDKVLIADLKEIQPFRNQCAHRGLLLTVEEQRNISFLENETLALNVKREATHRCFKKLIAEAKRLGALTDL
jgi:hypothetical protein